MTVSIAAATLRDLLAAVDSEGARAAAAVLGASGQDQFRGSLMTTAELLHIYERRLRMGRLDGVPGGPELVEGLRAIDHDEVLMVVIESTVGLACLWLSVGADSFVGAVASPAVVT